MRACFLTCIYLIIYTITLGQTYPCECSWIGRLIVKPLFKNGMVHYEILHNDTIATDSLGHDVVFFFLNQKIRYLWEGIYKWTQL